jgi:hypothetical protein
MTIHDDVNGGRWFEQSDLPSWRTEPMTERSRVLLDISRLEFRRRQIRRRWGYLAVRLIVAVGLFAVLLAVLPWWAAAIVGGTTASIIVDAT